MKMKKTLALILAAVMAVSALAMLTACKGGDTAATAVPTVKPTVAATAAETAAAESDKKDDAQDSAANSQGQQDTAQQDTKSIDADGYIDEQTAIANVKQQAGSGAQIISSEKGYAPDGAKAWIIVVSPITASEEAKTVTYYSGYQFCYSDEVAPYEGDDDGYIDEQLAIANVKQQAGTGAQVISSEKGYAPDGTRAWIVTVAPITASEEIVYDTYYSGYQFCYKAE